MKSKEQIQDILEHCGGSAQQAASLILSEAVQFKTGDTVVAVDDGLSVGGFVGKGTITGLSDDKGWAKLKLPDGSEQWVQSSLLYQVSL